MDRFLLRAAGETAAHGILYSYNLKALKNEGENAKKLSVRFTERVVPPELTLELLVFVLSFCDLPCRNVYNSGGLRERNVRLYIVIASWKTFLESHSLAVGQRRIWLLSTSVFFVLCKYR